MTANSSQPDAQNDFGSADDEIIRLYGSTKVSPPLQADKLKDVEEKKSETKTDGQYREYVHLRDQQDPLLEKTDGNKRSTRRQLLSSFDVPEIESHQSQSPWSSQADVSVRSSNYGWLQHPKIRENWKIVIGAFVLTLLGIILFLTGIGVAVSPAGGLHCLVFFIIGFLCFVPGLYHLIYMYCAVMGKPGYSFYNLPVLK